MPPLLVSLLLVAHGLVHASYASPEPPHAPGSPAWPFHLDRSWALTPAGLGAPAIRRVGLGLLAIVVAGYAVSALAVAGVAPGAWFGPTVVAASLASAAMLALFFSPWIVLGLVIDAALLVAVLMVGWEPGPLA